MSKTRYFCLREEGDIVKVAGWSTWVPAITIETDPVDLIDSDTLSFGCRVPCSAGPLQMRGVLRAPIGFDTTHALNFASLFVPVDGQSMAFYVFMTQEAHLSMMPDVRRGGDYVGLITIYNRSGHARVEPAGEHSRKELWARWLARMKHAGYILAEIGDDEYKIVLKQGDSAIYSRQTIDTATYDWYAHALKLWPQGE